MSSSTSLFKCVSVKNRNAENELVWARNIKVQDTSGQGQNESFLSLHQLM
jgi:hypothetical protein